MSSEEAGINKHEKKNTVYTVTANCQDCYRCVRVCPVKAISVRDGQARIEDDLCIKCGTCVRECPQHAKTIRSSLYAVKELLESGRMVAASVAPSFAAIFDGPLAARLPSALKRLGFGYVSETAEGAQLVTEETMKNRDKGAICTACPAVVNFIEKYRPEFVDMLIPVVSPMVAHGRLLKKRLGSDCTVVFIGPCAAKKREAQRPENAGAVDAVLTFTELRSWLADENIDLAACPESRFESFGTLDKARLFPLQGGLLKTGDVPCDGTNADVLHVSGAKDIIDLLDIPKDQWRFSLVEPLFCAGGCINGPGISSDKNVFLRKQDVIAYAESVSEVPDSDIDRAVPARAGFSGDSIGLISEEVDEEKIRQVLESQGKLDPELQLNCGACGYESCRDNAIAVTKGMAEPEMCLPYMRRLAQQRTDRIIETSPNGVVILDSELTIIHMNPAFQHMFMCTGSILGRRISYLLDADGYEKMASGKLSQYEAIKSRYGKKYHEQLYTLTAEGQYVGLYTDVTKIRFDNSQIDLIKRQTVEQAKELLDHQIRVSQEMAHFLGKSTARSEELVTRLMDLYEEKGSFE
ncbi:Iron only hydrogenase large subunit, C-terminal domain [Sporobacter termitidis DSM 10068]|uniref:Iron only hydrogenase large subunit, C-terminal domain n=1 Tax=Sporobacter termitidis DSM 10068 TaxID=1123282 RepID=A0A1M5YDL6_9FIRM|nr:[Fe-Fe] hydrogenase large subunit C-terminal domain-containing protein [Sporobacter termitidis]SHI09999.1 Iron only hydrogenase large subunit, C-terminal domain [Sporobacter termitidis DSM 10068]